MDESALKLVETKEDIKKNIETLDQHLNDPRNREYAVELIKRGICFVAKMTEDGSKFYPCKFIGYKNNTKEMHEKWHNNGRDGRDAEKGLNKILGHSPQPSEELENYYKNYCEKLGFKATKRKRKYWDKIL